jgi:outer membrane protein OmpA-like peptidoglycan-associated protein
MRLRNWLLTGTAVLAMLPGTAFAQQAELQALQEAQASGDADAIAAAEQALTEACIVNGYASIEECIAALTAAAADADAAAAAAAQAEAEAAAQAEADAQAAAAAQAEADAAAAAQAEADAQAAAAAQAEADAQAAAAAQAEADAAAAAQAEAEAQAAAAAQAEADAQAAAAAQAEADAAAAAQADADAQAAAAAQAEADAAAAAQAEADAAAQAEQARAQFVADLQAALDAYQAALNLAATDYPGAVTAAAAAEARILELCTTNGYPDIASCIGQELPPLPAPPAEQPAAEQPAEPATEQPAAETPAEPAAEQPAETPVEQPAEAGPTDQPADAGEVDPIAAAQEQLGVAVELYGVGIGQLEAGDPAGQSTIDAANRQFEEICAALGTPDVAACLAQYSITLPPVPELAAPAEPAPPPIAELPGAQLEVTPEAVEVLPEASAPEEAAPVLDSAKDLRIAVDSGQATEPAPVEPTEPAAPPPADDRAAQADIAAIQVVSPTQETGEQITFDQLGPVEVPQNVTIINNVTNVTNVTNITNNTTTINNNTTNNNGGNQGGPRPGRPDQPNYTNSGFIFNIGINLVISNPGQDFDRIREDDDEVYYERLPGGRVKETIERPNGVEIVTIRDRWGNVLKRSRIMPDGREYVLAYYDEDDYEDEDYFNNWRDPGEDLPPLRLTIPIREYIIDADYADEDEVEDFFREPPVENVRRIYTVEDVKRSARLRDSVRRIEVGSLTFDSGAATISRTQVGALSKVANAMLSMLEDNPGEVFLIEGHTDAVGGDQANLILSDARAATVARILTDFYEVPPENLVTQGYGERYLKVKTDGNEPLNRRVAVKRITPLITVADRN